jgi:hypothetical protein
MAFCGEVAQNKRLADSFADRSPAKDVSWGMQPTKSAEALWQTPDQRSSDTVTYRVFLDDAWRNVEGKAAWKNLPQSELIRLLEEVYFTPT